MLVLGRVSTGATQRNDIKVSKKMYHVIRVKLKIDAFYLKKKVFTQIQELKWPRAVNYNLFLSGIHHR